MNANKTILIATAVIITGLFAYLGIQNRRINRLTAQNQVQAVQIAVLNDSVSVFRSKNGELTYKLISAEVDRDNLRESLEAAGYSIKELKARDVEWQKITSALQLRLEASGSGTAPIRDTVYIAGADTVKTSSFAWSNDFLSLSGNVGNHALNFDYSYRTGIGIIQHRERQKTLVSVTLTDTNASIVSGNNITIAHQTRWYEKPWLWGLAGLAGGIIIAK